MQPFIQSRRIRAQLKEQLARHDGKPYQEDSSHGGDITTSQQKPVAEKETIEDLEKGRRIPDPPPTQNEPDASPTDCEEKDFEKRRSSVASRESVESSRISEMGDGEVRGPQKALHQSLSRATTRSQRTIGTALGYSLTGVDIRDRTTHEGGDRDRQVFVVGFEGPEDLTNPHNWSRARRVKVTILVASVGIIVGFASAIDSSILKPAAKEFGVSEVTESLATGLFLIGFGLGALVSGPFSETFGRTPVYISTMALLCIFTMASGLAPNIGAQLTFRFIAGIFGATPLTCAGGSMADMWNSRERTLAFPVFANAAFTGPLMGPVVGGWIAQYSNEISWRWTEWVTLICAGAVLTGLIVSMPETFAGILLSWKAKHLRDLTGDDRYQAPLEIKQETFLAKMKHALSRPFIMTVQEPILILITLYLTVIYIILFTFLDGYTYIFAEIHGTSDGITGLCFLGIVAGLFGASTVVWPVWILTLRDEKRAKAQGQNTFPPESRLWSAMLGGSIMIPLGLFWMAWTSYEDISIWSPLVASFFVGWGILTVFISSFQYVIDTYEVYSASALVFATLVRYIASGVMVVVGIPFYENLGVHYTLTILACLAAALAPLPFVFRRYGKAIRKRSKFALNQL